MRQPAKVPGAHSVVTIAAGSFHALALQEDGRVLSWGNGDYGQLGLGRPGNEDTPRAWTRAHVFTRQTRTQLQLACFQFFSVVGVPRTLIRSTWRLVDFTFSQTFTSPKNFWIEKDRVKLRMRKNE